MINYFSINKHISKNQYGLQHGDSCIDQLLSVTDKIFTHIDNVLEVRSVFLDISKVSDKFLHQGRIFKLNQNSISGELLHTLSDFFKQ